MNPGDSKSVYYSNSGMIGSIRYGGTWNKERRGRERNGPVTWIDSPPSPTPSGQNINIPSGHTFWALS